MALTKDEAIGVAKIEEIIKALPNTREYDETYGMAYDIYFCPKDIKAKILKFISDNPKATREEVIGEFLGILDDAGILAGDAEPRSND